MSNRLIEKIRGLQSFSLDSELELLAQTKIRKLEKHDLLLFTGDVCKNIYYVESGCFKSVLNEDGKEINLSFCLEDNFITNLKSLRNGTPSEYDIKACEPCLVWSFSKDSLLNLYKDSEEIASFGRNLLEQLLVEQEDHSNLFKIKNPAERYQYMVKNYPLLLQKITLTELSSYLGISRETVSRIRKNR